MIERKRCAHCRRLMRLNPRVKSQRYCGSRACQRARKTSWQREQMSRDRDYQANHKRAQADWAEGNPGYWALYRSSHPDYRERNRILQKERDARRRERNLAKMDALSGRKHIEPGTYYLFPPGLPDLAKMDAFGQKVVIISEGFPDSGAILQRRTRLPAPARSP